MTDLDSQILHRRTFAIISHPDAGKTTLTEKLLLHGGAIQLAGTVKARKSARHATSDWMALEKERGISVTSSVMQFQQGEHTVNLLDTPGHADFSEDTYRTLTAVDSALMMVDAAKGVEERTVKLMEVCRLRDTPIFTFVNKLDRDGREPIDVLDEIEQVLGIQCAPVTWPIGMGSDFRGVYHLERDEVILYRSSPAAGVAAGETIAGLDNPLLDEALGPLTASLRDDVELLTGASHRFERAPYLAGEQTPVFFGTALHDFGVNEMMDVFVEHAPPPRPRKTTTREVQPQEASFTGFVFKIQANMDPAHRDRVAFLRVCSGTFNQAMRMRHVRLGREVKATGALTFMASDRNRVAEAFPGDIIGLPNHGTIRIGDTFSEGEDIRFTGVPSFAPEIFRRVRLRDPLRLKALQKGLDQLCEEGATQVFRPLVGNDIILGAVGTLQFDVVAFRLRSEYRVECSFESAPVQAARWVSCDDPEDWTRFQNKLEVNLSRDHGDDLVYLAPTTVNLQLAQERWPAVDFHATREHN